MSNHIPCPSCGESIQLTEALSDQVKKDLQKKYNDELKKRESEFLRKEKDMEMSRAKLEQREQDLRKEVDAKVQEEKMKLWKTAQQKAEEKLATEIKDIKAQNDEKSERLKRFEQTELDLRKRARQLEEEKKEMDLQMQRKLDEEYYKIKKKAHEQADEENKRKLIEKDQQMEQMRKQIDDLKRKSEQGSQQIQGDAQEEDHKRLLQASFPLDLIEDVATGQKGADLIHTVNSSTGTSCGIILWESKNTKAFSTSWIKKMKDDQAIHKADICILITRVLPDNVKSFDLVDGVWVCDIASALPLANALRLNLIQINQVKNSLVGRDEKMEYLYNYLSGSQFRTKMENIVMAFSGMKNDLETEKRSMNRIWSKREKEIERVVMNTSGMYGDMQGIIGASLPDIQSLEMPIGDQQLKHDE